VPGFAVHSATQLFGYTLNFGCHMKTPVETVLRITIAPRLYVA